MLKKYTFLTIILLGLLNIHITIYAQTIGVPGSLNIRLSTSTGQSAYIADNYLNTPWPNHPDLASISWVISDRPASARTLFQFNLNLIPEGANIIDAKLSLYSNPTPSNTGHYGNNSSFLRRVTTPWSADSVVWEKSPDFTHHNQILLPVVSANQDLLDINVTDLIKDMIQNPESGYGFILMQRFEYPRICMNFASGVCPDTSKRPLLVITYDSPTPVELLNFISVINGRIATLKWITKTEINNAGFEIQRRYAKNNLDWKKIGFVQGNGNSTNSIEYTYEDKNLNSGRYQYRLKQIDNNGNFKYYDLTGEVNIGIPAKFSLYQNYPNPFNPNTIINYDIPQDSKVVIKIYDINGREVKTLVNEFKTAGYYSNEFDGSNLSSGSYFYNLKAGEFNVSKGMQLVK